MKLVEPVVITGMGVLSCIGLGREAYWDGLRTGRSGIRQVQRFDASELPCQIAGELWGFDPANYMSKHLVSKWHRHVHQAVAVARLAVQDADLEAAGYDPDRMAVGMGTSIGNPDESYQRYLDAYKSGGFKKLGRYASSASSGHSATVHVSIDIGIRGPAITIASGCATGLDILTWGYEQVRSNKVDAAVIGATESPIFLESFAPAAALGILSKRNEEPEKAMRPFDRYRDGIVLSEGAVALVLERADRARARGAPILAEVAGNGSAADARSPLVLDPQGRALGNAIRMALRDAGMEPHEIAAIQAHGVSLASYDHCETRAYKSVFGDHAYRMPISAVKSMVGQAYSAGGLLGVGGALLTLNEGIIPPTLNLEDPDPECDLDYVPQVARLNDADNVLVTSISFGGTHSATVLRRVA